MEGLSPIVRVALSAVESAADAVADEFYSTDAVSDERAQTLYNATLAALSLGAPRDEVHAAMRRGKAKAKNR